MRWKNTAGQLIRTLHSSAIKILMSIFDVQKMGKNLLTQRNNNCVKHLTTFVKNWSHSCLHFVCVFKLWLVKLELSSDFLDLGKESNEHLLRHSPLSLPDISGYSCIRYSITTWYRQFSSHFNHRVVIYNRKIFIRFAPTVLSRSSANLMEQIRAKCIERWARNKFKRDKDSIWLLK